MVDGHLVRGFSTRVLEVYFSNDIRFHNMVGFAIWVLYGKPSKNVTDFSLVGVFREIFVSVVSFGLRGNGSFTLFHRGF